MKRWCREWLGCWLVLTVALVIVFGDSNAGLFGSLFVASYLTFLPSVGAWLLLRVVRTAAGI